MINNELLGYIKHQISLNISKETIVNDLKSTGWTDIDIHEAFVAITPKVESNPIPAPNLVQNTIPATPVMPIQNINQTSNPVINENKTFQKYIPKNRRIIEIIFVIMFLAITGGGVYAYYTGALISFPSLVSESIDNTRATNSVIFDTTISIDVSEIKSMSGDVGQLLPGISSSDKIIVTTKGMLDSSDIKNTKSSTVVSLDFGSMSLKAEIRTLDKFLYITLIKAPSIGLIPLLSKYENQWISFPFKSENGQSIDSTVSSLSGVNTNITEKMTPENKDHLYKMIRDAKLIKTVKKFPYETIGGASSYHFAFDLDREGINAYLLALKEYVNTVGKNDSSMSAFDPTSLNKDIEKIQDFNGEIWIGRSDKLIHKFMINFSVKPDTTKEEKMKINLVGIFSDWNKPTSIVAPTESIPFETFISGLMGDSLGAAREKGKDAAIKANLSNMRAQAELFYDSNNPSTYLGFCQSKELKAARKAIEDNGGSRFTCISEVTKYSIGVKLVSPSDYWCVDSTGYGKITKSLTVSTSCPVK